MTDNAEGRRAQVLMLLNASFLMVHQIDSAFWHEWEMFHLPGGNQLNLILNVPIVALVVYAYGKVAANRRGSRAWQKLVCSLGFTTLLIHAGFYLAGHKEFLQPVSLGIFLAIALVSTAQIFSFFSKPSKSYRSSHSSEID